LIGFSAIAHACHLCLTGVSGKYVGLAIAANFIECLPGGAGRGAARPTGNNPNLSGPSPPES
jgi:hypothetical protein